MRRGNTPLCLFNMNTGSKLTVTSLDATISTPILLDQEQDQHMKRVKRIE